MATWGGTWQNNVLFPSKRSKVSCEEKQLQYYMVFFSFYSFSIFFSFPSSLRFKRGRKARVDETKRLWPRLQLSFGLLNSTNSTTPSTREESQSKHGDELWITVSSSFFIFLMHGFNINHAYVYLYTTVFGSNQNRWLKF